MRRVLLACAALALLAGCRIETTVGIDAAADGSGRVRVVVALDRDAASQVPDLAEQLRTDDLLAAGWDVEAPRRVDGGGLEVAAAKRFESADELADVVAEVSGEDGPFRAFRLRRARSFLTTKVTLTGTVDLDAGLEAFGDETLRERVGAGPPLGFDPADLERRLGAALDRVFVFRVVARLPGSVDSNAPTETGNGAVWRPKLGETVALAADAEQWNVRTLGGGAVAVGAAGALVAVLLRRRGRDPRRDTPI